MAVNNSYENNVEYAPFNSVNRDRAINADHLARWLSSVNSDGVARQYNEFECTLSGGMNVVLDTGIGLVRGHHCYLKSSQIITIDTASTSGKRIDTIGFRLEVANRKVLPYYKTGEVGSNTPPVVLDNNDYVEIPLYNIEVPQGASSLSSDNLKDVRTFVVSSATVFKKYNQVIQNTTSTTSTITITVPFNNNTDDVDVYVNGIVLLENQYSISGNVITFNRAINAGNQIQISVWHFQDGSGEVNDLEEVLTEIDEVKKVTKYYYQCTGDNDNIKLSNIAQNFLSGSGEFSGIDAYAQMEIIVCGDMIAVNTAYSGNGSSDYPFTYFAFGRAASSTRTIYFDFSNCSRIRIVPNDLGDNVNYTIFSGADINVRNVQLSVELGYNVDIFNGQNIHCQDSEFWMTTTNDCCVGRCCGYFENVRTSISSRYGNAFCFYGNGRLLRVVGGTHYAWTGSAGSGKEAVCFYVAAYQTENVLFVSMANMPEYPRSGYTQSRPVKINHGWCTIMMNAMWMAATQGNGSFYSSEKCIASGNAIISKN